MKYAVLSMDIEDWYHTTYLLTSNSDREYSMLDGISRYLEILERFDVPSTFFVLGELVESIKNTLNEISRRAASKSINELALHGWDHTRSILIARDKFKEELERGKKTLEDLIGTEVIGYRAPCFSLDRSRLDILKAIGFHYDSSRIIFEQHPLYTGVENVETKENNQPVNKALDISGFERLSDNIFCLEDFFEFQISTLKVWGKTIPVAGGGYLRIFPWILMKKLVKSYLKDTDLYILYIHPFELSVKPSPVFPKETKVLNRLRFNTGRDTVYNKLCALIKMLKDQGMEFTTFSALREKMLHASL